MAGWSGDTERSMVSGNPKSSLCESGSGATESAFTERGEQTWGKRTHSPSSYDTMRRELGGCYNQSVRNSIHIKPSYNKRTVRPNRISKPLRGSVCARIGLATKGWEAGFTFLREFLSLPERELVPAMNVLVRKAHSVPDQAAAHSTTICFLRLNYIPKQRWRKSSH